MSDEKKELLEVAALLIQTAAAIVYLVRELKPQKKLKKPRKRPKR